MAELLPAIFFGHGLSPAMSAFCVPATANRPSPAPSNNNTSLQADIYAVAALAAGVVVVIGYDLHYPAFVVLTVGALLCFWLRVMAIYRGWHLPVAQSQNRQD